MLSRVAGSPTRRRNALSPLADAHAGTSTPMPVYDAVYGYWSAITSMPFARAESIMASVFTLAPHIGLPITL
jgi:hypothetical protein